MGRARLRKGIGMGNHRRFFVDPNKISNCEAILDGPVARQIAKVLRLKTGDRISLLDGFGNTYSADIASVSTDTVTAKILDKKSNVNEPRLKLTLASCLPKSDRMELIVQKCTELGISEILLVQSERTIARPDEDRQGKRLARLCRIATESTEQCGRSIAPKIRGTLDFAQLIEIVPKYDLTIVAWEEEDGVSLRNALTDKNSIDSALVVIGPEGGLTQREVESLKSAGAISVSLGPRLLRTDTAAIATCAAVMYELEFEL